MLYLIHSVSWQHGLGVARDLIKRINRHSDTDRAAKLPSPAKRDMWLLHALGLKPSPCPSMSLTEAICSDLSTHIGRTHMVSLNGGIHAAGLATLGKQSVRCRRHRKHLTGGNFMAQGARRAPRGSPDRLWRGDVIYCRPS